MRRLLLLRHAKAERPPGVRDQDRVLADRGRADARTVGAYLARHDAIPDRALVSPAARTRETWALVAAGLGKAPPVSFDDRLYDASPQAILGAVQDSAAEAGSLLVIGHNPGMAELATALVASGDLEARERLGRGFPTAALAIITFATDQWAGVHIHGGRLEHFVTPKWLAKATD